MEEKNRASEMLNQMKKYLHTDKESDEVTEEITENDITPEPPKEEEPVKTVRRLPKDEALFEFDDIAFDDAEIEIEHPVLTPEEAEYAEALSEKFGISRSAGIGFLDDTPAEDEGAPAPFSAHESVENAESAVVEETAEAVDEAVALNDDKDESAAEADVIENEASSAPVSCENGESNDSEDSDGPEQVTFGVPQEVAKTPEKSATPTGVQITFLDPNQTYEPEIKAEQIVLGEYDDDDDDDVTVQESAAAENTAATEEVAEENTEAADEEESEAWVDEVVEAEEASIAPATHQMPVFGAAPAVNEEPVEESVEENAEESAKQSEAVAAESVAEQPESTEEVADEDEADYEFVQPQEPVELTPIELNALEEEARAAAEAAAEAEEEVERVKQEVYENDIWDKGERAAYAEKKRFSDFCSKLDIPPIRITKESKEASAAKQTPSSGYRYEMTERLPLFPDGMGEGKNNESYIKRELEYCEEREKKRSGILLDKLRFASRKLICSFVVLLTVLLIENLGAFFGGKPDGLLKGDYSMAFAISVAVLLAIGAGLVFDSIRDGIKSAASGVFIPETLTALVAIPAVLYHAVIAFVAPHSEYSMLFGTGAAAVMFLSALYRYNMLRRDQVAFSVTSSHGEYLTEVKMAGFKTSPEGKAYDGYAKPETSLYKCNKVARIDASYTDSQVQDECFGVIRKLFLCMVCAAVVAGVVFGIIKMDVIYGVLSAISILTYSAPASVFIALSLPRLRAAVAASAVGGAIVDFDDESDDFDSSVIMIEEEELFPPEKLVSYEFKFQQSPMIESHLSRTRALFKTIGGSLSSMFSYVEGTAQNFESVVITEITDDGISAKIDGVAISAGSDTYMKKLGIKIKRGDKLLPKNGRVMYIADNGEFFARATLLFRVNEELVQKISELRNTETLFTLKSCNPCIDEDLLFYTTGLEPELIKLVKYEAGDNVAPGETDREGSLVSKSGALGLLCALFEYKRQKKLVRQAAKFACVSCVVGAIISVFTSIIGVNFGFSALLMLATHGAFTLAAFLMSRRGAINTKSKIKKK